MIQIKHNKLRIPAGGRLTSWLFTKRGVIEFGATEDKSIHRKGGGFEPGISGLQVQRPTTRPHSPPHDLAHDWSSHNKHSRHILGLSLTVTLISFSKDVNIFVLNSVTDIASESTPNFTHSSVHCYACESTCPTFI